MPIISTFPTGESTVDYVGPKSGLPALEEGKVGYATDEKHLYAGNADGQNTQIPNADDLKTHTDDGDIHVTAEKKAVWDKSVVIGEEKTLIKLPSEENGNTICYGGDKFVVGGKGITAYSNDGMLWNKVRVLDPNEKIFDFLYGGTHFVGNLLNSNKYLYSSNGIDWNVNKFPTKSSFYRTCYGNGKYVFLNCDNGIVFPISESMLNLNITNKHGYPLPQNDATWSTICFGGGKFVVVSASGSKAAYSSDGINWTETTMIEGKDWVNSCYGNGKFVVISGTETFAAYSEDGVSWYKADLPSGVQWGSVCYGAGKFVAVSMTNGIAAYSTDGISWNQTTLPSDTTWVSVCFGDGRFIAVQEASGSSEQAPNALHDDRIIAYSTDGVNWTSEALLPSIKNVSGESSIESVKSALHYTPEEIGAEPRGMAMRCAEDMAEYLKYYYANKTEVSDAVDSHNLAEDAHAAKFAEHNTSENAHADKFAAVNAAIGNLTPSACKVMLSASGWDSSAKTQSATVSGVLEDESKQLIMPMPAGTSMSAYNAAGIQMTAQAANTVTFTADTVPTTSIDVWVVFQNVNDVTPPPLDEASWEYISQQSLAGNAKNIWSVGDCKAVKLSGTASKLSLDTTLYVYILDFDHDNSTVDGTKDGITFGTFKTALTGGKDVCLMSGYDDDSDFRMNASNFGGWKNSNMRYNILGSTNIQNGDATATTATSPKANTLMSCLPADLRAVMRPMCVYTDNTSSGPDTASYVTTTIDFLPLLAEFEIFGYRYLANSAEKNNQTQYACFKNGNSRVKYRHNSQSSTTTWWSRSPSVGGNTKFCCVEPDGLPSTYKAAASGGLAPMFKI